MRRAAIPVLGALLAGTAYAGIYFDDLSTDQFGTSSLDIAGVIGGERDIRTVNPDNTVAVSGGAFTCSGANAFSGCTLDYDGNDNDPTTLAVPGFAPVDLTAGGQDSISVSVDIAQGGCNLNAQLCDASSNCANPGITDATPGTHLFGYANFAGVDPTAITVVRFVLTLRTNPSTCSITAMGTAADSIFGDGFETP